METGDQFGKPAAGVPGWVCLLSGGETEMITLIHTDNDRMIEWRNDSALGKVC